MNWPVWHEEPVGRHQDRAGFDCGQHDLNQFLRERARQNHERGAAKTFLAVDSGDGKTVHGFYSLCPAALEYSRAPEAVQRGLARHDIGAYRLARLAASVVLQGKGFGGQLLLAAGRRCLRVASEAGGTLMLIDAKDERVAAFYTRFGALALPDSPLTLVLPLSIMAAALKAVGATAPPLITQL